MPQYPTFSTQFNNHVLLGRLLTDYPNNTHTKLLLVNIKQQILYAIDTQQLACKSYPISSASNGIGSESKSGKTPLGAHFIREKFGDNAKPGSIFKGRKEIGKIAKILTNPNEQSTDDNITTRIMWLSGLEEGQNKGGQVDSYYRYIYIHGTDEEGRLGAPASHGCIRMSNQSITTLYQMTPINTLLYIIAE